MTAREALKWALEEFMHGSGLENDSAYRQKLEDKIEMLGEEVNYKDFELFASGRRGNTVVMCQKGHTRSVNRRTNTPQNARFWCYKCSKTVVPVG